MEKHQKENTSSSGVVVDVVVVENSQVYIMDEREGDLLSSPLKFEGISDRRPPRTTANQN